MLSFGLPEELRAVEAALVAAPDDAGLLLRRAAALDALGQTDAAREAYVAVIRRDPSNADALNNLGTLLFNSGYRSAARLTYRELLKHHPRHVMGLVNLGNAELEDGRLDAARVLYEAAITVEPRTALAHQGLSYVFVRMGDTVRGQRHRDVGFTLAPMLISPFRGASVPVTVLLLLAPQRANIATELVLDDTTFLVVKLFPEYYDETLPLPPHDVIFNAIGDAELSSRALAAASRIVGESESSVINDPLRVVSTSRAEIARRLRGIDGLVVARTERVARDRLAGIDWPMPFLLRSPGYHTGEHFELVRDRADLENTAARLPGDELLTIEFLDARGSDGATRKYRVLFIDGKMYPLHLARSTNWKVHYFSADLVASPDAMEEERRFLDDAHAAIGERAVRALEAIRDELQLDYFGVDFGLDEEGNALLFEANATMKIVPPGRDDPNEARREAARAALKAARDMVLRLRPDGDSRRGVQRRAGTD